MQARDIMVSDFPVVSSKIPIREAVRLLKKNFADETSLNSAPGLVVLSEKGELAGILSPLTIIRAMLDSAAEHEGPAEGTTPPLDEVCRRIKDKRVEDVMDWQSISVTEDADIIDVAALFVKHRFQRIPVVKNKEVTGIIYRSRLLFAMTSCLVE